MMQIAFNLPPLLAQDEPAGDWLFWIIAVIAIIVSVVRYLAQQKAEQRQRQARKAPPKTVPQPPKPAPGPRPSAPAKPPVQLHEKLRRIEEARRRVRQAPPPPVPVLPVVEPEIVLQPARQPAQRPAAQPRQRKTNRPAKVQYVSKEEMLRQARAKQGVQLQKMLQNLPTGMGSYGGDSGSGGRVNTKRLGLRSRSDLARAILLREVLGPPKALQKDEPF